MVKTLGFYCRGGEGVRFPSQKTRIPCVARPKAKESPTPERLACPQSPPHASFLLGSDELWETESERV